MLLTVFLTGDKIFDISNIYFLGKVEAGEWQKIEIRLKLNDIGNANGEFMFFFNDQLTSHINGLSKMIPDEDYHITHSRFWVFNNWPGASTGGPVYFKNYFVSQFSSDPILSSYTQSY